MDAERWFERLANATEDFEASAPAPARLKATIYSAVVQRLADTGPLLGLAETKAAGSGLCVFEEALAVVPSADSMNPCRVCHARLLAERLEPAPIFWPHCPYAAFHRQSSG
jgi:hypothetical protein